MAPCCSPHVLHVMTTRPHTNPQCDPLHHPLRLLTHAHRFTKLLGALATNWQQYPFTPDGSLGQVVDVPALFRYRHFSYMPITASSVSVLMEIFIILVGFLRTK
ncbi:hypothetical protein AMECASPLE_031882 [Ameca splendens]|uniref:Uncharacterized protein n=1 Tax=Ameca splendens TaxID=208324 RepID=A0ABV0YTZ6_9TELE